MYLKHFAFCCYPFGNDIPPDEMYTSTGRPSSPRVSATSSR
jgi:hypothetical protein